MPVQLYEAEDWSIHVPVQLYLTEGWRLEHASSSTTVFYRGLEQARTAVFCRGLEQLVPVRLYSAEDVPEL